MAKILTIQIPDILEHQLRLEAQKLNLPLEEFVLQSLTQIVSTVDEDDEPEEVILSSLRQSLQDVKAGRVRPVSELWEGIDE